MPSDAGKVAGVAETDSDDEPCRHHSKDEPIQQRIYRFDLPRSAMNVEVFVGLRAQKFPEYLPSDAEWAAWVRFSQQMRGGAFGPFEMGVLDAAHLGWLCEQPPCHDWTVFVCGWSSDANVLRAAQAKFAPVIADHGGVPCTKMRHDDGEAVSGRPCFLFVFEPWS